MKKLWFVILLIIVLIAGVFAIKTYKKQTLINDYVCGVNGVDYYIHNDVMYFTSNEGKEYIYTYFGFYERKPTKDGWTLTFHQNEQKSIYVTVFDWIKAGEHPLAGKIACKSFDEFPEGFDTFIKMHPFVFDEMAKDFKEVV